MLTVLALALSLASLLTAAVALWRVQHTHAQLSARQSQLSDVLFRLRDAQVGLSADVKEIAAHHAAPPASSPALIQIQPNRPKE